MFKRLLIMIFFILFSSKLFAQNEYMENTEFKIFVSSAMGESLLKRYVGEASKYKAILIFKGLPNGSWRDLSRLVHNISCEKEIQLQIDDESFRKYKVNTVPTFILSKNNIFDRVVGNIGIKRALELMASEGDLADQALKILKEG